MVLQECLLSTRNHFKSEISFFKNLSTNYNKLKLTSKRYSRILAIMILLHSKSNKKYQHKKINVQAFASFFFIFFCTEFANQNSIHAYN